MSQEDPGRVTALLQKWRDGDVQALEDVVPLVYQELRRLAHHHLRSERAGSSLQSTALVHEAYLRLVGAQPAALNDRNHFIAVASRLMRQILVDSARARGATKRAGGNRIELEVVQDLPIANDAQLIALNDALEELCKLDERQGKIVEMKFFGGLSAPEISEILGLSRATVDREWATARVWLHRQMNRS